MKPTHKGPTLKNSLRSDLAISKTVRSPIPHILFKRVARTILPRRYELSLVLCGDRLARRLNTQYRDKHYCPNVLSFPLSKREGEIFLNVRAAERDAKKYGVSLRARMLLLFIHACAHLKGLHHGKRMERQESKVLRQFL